MLERGVTRSGLSTGRLLLEAWESERLVWVLAEALCCVGGWGELRWKLIYGVSRSMHMVLAKRKELSPNPEAEGSEGC